MSGKWGFLRRLLIRFARAEEGPTATEYAILLAMIILVSVAMIGRVGESFARLYAIIADSVPTPAA